MRALSIELRGVPRMGDAAAGPIELSRIWSEASLPTLKTADEVAVGVRMRPQGTDNSEHPRARGRRS